MLRLILGVLRSRRAQSVALFTLATLAVAAATATPLYATAADRATVAAQLRAATAAERAITSTAEVSALHGYSSALDALSREVAARVGQSPLTQVSGALVAGSVSLAGSASIAAPVATRDDACAHLMLLEGTCPIEAADVVLSEPTARHLDAHIASELEVLAVGSSTPVMLRVAGVYDAAATERDSDPYWAGRVDLTPKSLRVTNPMFVASNAIDTLGVERVVAMVDLYAEARAVNAGNLAAVAATALEAAQELPDAQVTKGLSRLLLQVQASREELGLTAPLGAMRVLFFAWFVLLIAVAHLATARRAELALISLRGVPARHRVLFSLGPTVLLLMVAGWVGVGLGWLTVHTVTSTMLAEATPVTLDNTALLTAAGTLLLVLVSVVIAERRAVRGSVNDALREVPKRRGRGFGPIELAAIVVAAIAVSQSYASPDLHSGLVLFAPMLVALAIGLLTARLVRPVATVYGSDRLHRGHLATAIAALQLARRPGADRIVALTVVVVSLVGYTVCAWDVAVVDARRQAELDLGAPRVLTVSAASSAALIAAVHRADPDGTWAMAATRTLDGKLTSIGVESSRLAATAIWPRDATLSPREAAEAMRPRIAESVILTGSDLELDLTVVQAMDGPMHITAGLVGPSGESIVGEIDVAPELGRARYSMALPVCATEPGCRLAWLSFPRSADDLQVNALIQQQPQRTLLAGNSISSASRWRSALGSESEVTIISGTSLDATAAAPIDGAAAPGLSSHYVSLRYSPALVFHPSTDIRMYLNDGPLPLPLVVAGPRSLADTRELSAPDALPSMPGPVDALRISPVLPGVASSGVLFDLEYADRIDADLDDAVSAEVWLGAEAPTDAVERIRAEGLQVLRDEEVIARVAHAEEQGAGLAARLEVGAAVLSVLLVVVGLFVLSATDRRSRATELAALMSQGLPAATAARAARLGNLAMIAVAAPIGVLAAAVTWALPGRAGVPMRSNALPLPDPNMGVAGATIILVIAVLLAAVLLAGRSLIDAATRGDDNTAGGQR